MAIHSAPDAPKHLLVDLFGVSAAALGNPDALIHAIKTAAASGLNAKTEDLQPTLLTNGCAQLISLNGDGYRLCITLFPELRFAFFDCFVFSSVNPEALYNALADFFQPEMIRKTTLARGAGV